MKVAVVGGGWAGLAAAVEAVTVGHDVTVFDMAPQLGGRARSVTAGGLPVDNGQHILIGAYANTLALMQRVGVDLSLALHRMPLELRYPDGSGLKMTPGSPVIAFLKAVGAYRGWPVGARLALLQLALRWRLSGFRCDPAWTVDRLCRALPRVVRDEFIDPLCVAALNTPADKASAVVFLRVLRDALLSGPGSADLLLPRCGLDALLPAPASTWLQDRGVAILTGRRVSRVDRQDKVWLIDGQAFDAVVLACTAVEAARLSAPLAPEWADAARGLRYEPIVTVYIQASQASPLPSPMMALRSSETRPAQYVFDHGALSGRQGLMALVVSGASPWIERGLEATAQAALAQLCADFPQSLGSERPRVLEVLSEKRATFLCTPGLRRPTMEIANGLVAAGDYVQGPYPATLEGAVRSGLDAARSLRGSQ